MGLPEEIIPYVDGNHLVAPCLVPSGVTRGSDNGPMYTAEYLIMLKYNNLPTNAFTVPGLVTIHSCVDSSDHLHRAPGDPSADEPDDYYGVFAAFSVLGINSYIKLPLLLWRQPQLLLASIAAKYGRIPFWAYPIIPIAAIVIATACVNAATSDTDGRRLSWLLIQALKGKSWLCDQAAKLWYKRLYRDYGPTGMKAVAEAYYRDNHPFTKYWITEYA